jgi:predicted transcriptional regulator
MAHDELTDTIRFRASKKTGRKLERLARHFARSPSFVLRQLIDEAEARIRHVAVVPVVNNGTEEK